MEPIPLKDLATQSRGNQIDDDNPKFWSGRFIFLELDEADHPFLKMLIDFLIFYWRLEHGEETIKSLLANPTIWQIQLLWVSTATQHSQKI